jgi:hypothetical protein
MEKPLAGAHCPSYSALVNGNLNLLLKSALLLCGAAAGL